MSSPLARSLLREFTNWRPRTSKEDREAKCKKCGHEYFRHEVFPMFTNIFWNLGHINELSDEELHSNMNSSNFTFCSSDGCHCSGFVD
jgi:hypothetical protein